MSISVCIIGSGYSAAALTLHLVTNGMPADQIAIVGPSPLGQGQAYGCISDDFRLNVRADLMRLWPDDPDHFATWAAENITDDPDSQTAVGHFYRRRDFAIYMADQLASCAGISDIQRHDTLAESITHDPDKDCDDWWISLADGTRFAARKIVIASGNPAPEWPMIPPPDDAPDLVRIPWRGDWPDRIATDARVVIIGGGLTALDALHSLYRRQHDAAITLICPEGMLPPVQTGWDEATPLIWPTPLRASGFLRFMRQTVGDADWTQTEWQRRFESLRVNISATWQSLPAADQARLMRRVGWLWSLARFRAGPQASGSAQTLIDSGQLKIRRDIVTGLEPAPDGHYLVSLGGGEQITADAIVNCSGAGRDTLMSRLIDDGLIAGHDTAPHRPRITADLTLVRPDGTPHDGLYAVGPVTAHFVGDILGAASISRQAKTLADRIMADRR